MSSIPPHYSERYVNQRYNKALQIVQRLPASSAFQPSRKQKLELYAYYKQVSHGDINTQRPGIFDVVGRAKWDAWKKLEGMSKLEAKHRYVDTLLKAATEAYKTPSSRPTAQQIIHAFALIKPSGENDTEDDDFDTEDQASQDEDSSLASADAEEQAYLMEIEADTGRLNSSSHTEISSPEVQRRRIVSPASSTRSRGHKRRSWHDNTTRQHTDRLLPHMIPARERLTASGRSSRNRSYDDENLNPWADRYGSSEENERRTPSRIAMRNALSVTRSPTPRSRVLKPRLPHLQSPFIGSSTSSSVTATASNVVGQATNMPPADSRASSRQAEHHVVALGPATKRALQSLQAEVVALNERIDDLRRELRTSSVEPHVTVAAPAAAMPGSSGSSSNGDDDAISDSWKWVIRAALKHAAVNLVTILIFLFILYKRGSPVAFAITDQFSKLWRNVKHRMFFHVVV